MSEKVLDAYHRKLWRDMEKDEVAMVKFERRPCHEMMDKLVVRSVIAQRERMHKDGLYNMITEEELMLSMIAAVVVNLLLVNYLGM